MTCRSTELDTTAITAKAHSKSWCCQRATSSPTGFSLLLVDVLAEEFGIDVCPIGSTTFKRSELLEGFEPDSGFYFAKAAARLDGDLNPEVDPPPDLIIEVDITIFSLDRFPIFAAFGVPEVWRYDGTRAGIFRLEAGDYREASSSGVLPAVTGEMATRFLDESRELSSTQWLRRVREWARQQR